MADVKELLTRKVGPLPAFVWVGAIAGGLWYGSRRRANGEPDAIAGVSGVSSSATRDGDAIEAPDEGTVVFSPVITLPEGYGAGFLPAPGDGLTDAPDAPSAPASTTTVAAPAPVIGPPSPVSRLGSSAQREAEEAARVAFRNGHPTFSRLLTEARAGNKKSRRELYAHLVKHPNEANTWARIGGSLP